MNWSAALGRFLSPSSVAIVGASERSRISNTAVANLLGGPAELHLVNPGSPELYGRPTIPSLEDLDGPVDAVLSLVGAARVPEVVRQAARRGCGGVVVVASGFAEAGPEGRSLQEQIRTTAIDAGIALCGPNCTGFVNATTGVSLFTGTAVRNRPGRIAIVSQSGFLMRSAMVAARERNLGLSMALSCGNEAAVGLADYLHFLAEDPATGVICTIIEKVRDADRFFAAAEACRRAGKPLVALKLGRSPRAREIVRSHTGALTDDSWVYDIGLERAGAVGARDIDDLLDSASVLTQLPRSAWGPIRRAAVVSSSGGVAAVASDMVTDEGLALPSLDHLLDAVRRRVPGAPLANPLDLTGFALGDDTAVSELLDLFAGAEEVDVVVVCWWLGDDDEERAELLMGPARGVASARRCPIVLATVEHSRIGEWTSKHDGSELVFGRGLRATARALLAVDRYIALSDRLAPPEPVAVEPLPLPGRPVEGAAGPMLSFADCMRLLSNSGVPVAPWTTLEATDEVDQGLLASWGGDLVAKLADVPHRGAIDAVELGLAPRELPAVLSRLRSLAAIERVPETVALQRLEEGGTEVFVGIRSETDLGPILVIGIGGAEVESSRRIVGRLLPLDEGIVGDMLGELSAAHPRDIDLTSLDTAALRTLVLSTARLGQRARRWLESLDLNPVICRSDGVVAVDALFLLKS